MRRKLSKLTVGDKFIVKVPQLRNFLDSNEISPPYAVHRVVDATTDTIRSEGPDGETLSFAIDVYGEIRDWRLAERVASTGPFPAADDATIISYALPLLTGDRHDQEIAVYITEIGDRTAYGHIVQFDEPRFVGELSGFDDPEAATSVVGNALFHDLRIALKDSDKAWKAGDLIVANGFKCKVRDGVHVTTLKNPSVLANLDTREDVGRFWPDASDLRPSFLLAYQCLPSFLHEMGRATAALDRDAALIFVLKDGDREDHHLVSHSGALLYSWEDAGDYFSDFPGEGLWLASDLRGWAYTSHEGEHDAGIDYGVSPATLEDIASFGFTEASLSIELTDIIGDGQKYLTNDFIEKAKNSEKSAEAEAEARRMALA